jgi:hypothetical protein
MSMPAPRSWAISSQVRRSHSTGVLAVADIGAFPA